MKEKLILLLLIAIPFLTFSQEYKEWHNHDVVRFYKKVELDYNSLDETGEEIDEIYLPIKVEDGVYKAELRKISSKLYHVYGVNIYMFFRYSPYLHNYDKGVLEVSYNSGIFYENP